MERVINAINKIFKIDEITLHELISGLQPLALPKRTILIAPGKRDDNVYFIEKGIARSYILMDGREVTSWFSKEGDLTFSTNSFYGKTEGYENEMVSSARRFYFIFYSYRRT